MFNSVLNFYKWWISECDGSVDGTIGFVISNILIMIAVTLSVFGLIFANWLIGLLIACVWIPVLFTIWMKFNGKKIDDRISELKELEKRNKKRYY